jgi:hypothetical protein
MCENDDNDVHGAANTSHLVRADILLTYVCKNGGNDVHGTANTSHFARTNVLLT